MVQHVMDALACFAADCCFANIADNEAKAAALVSGNGLLEILAISGREVVEADNGLTESEEILDDIGANEARGARDKPCSGSSGQLVANVPIVVRNHALTRYEYPRGRWKLIVRGEKHLLDSGRPIAAIRARARSIFHS